MPTPADFDDSDNTLLGSNLLPSTFADPAGELVQLGEVVREAFKRSGLTADAWNTLVCDESAKSEAMLQAVVDEWKLTGHGYTPPGFLPCPREPMHDGPCAHAIASISESQAHALGIGVLPGVPDVLRDRGVTTAGATLVATPVSERTVKVKPTVDMTPPETVAAMVAELEAAIEPKRDPECAALGRHRSRCECAGSMREPI